MKKIICPKCKKTKRILTDYGYCLDCYISCNENNSTHAGKHLICYIKAYKYKNGEIKELKCCICFKHECEDSDEPDYILDL